jgi:lysophospholipase L1-like esterase
MEELNKKIPQCSIYIQSVLPAYGCDLKTIKELNSQYEHLVKETANCYYIDLFDKYMTEEGTRNVDLFSRDGVHLNGEGYEIWLEEIDQYIYDK